MRTTPLMYWLTFGAVNSISLSFCLLISSFTTPILRSCSTSSQVCLHIGGVFQDLRAMEHSRTRLPMVPVLSSAARMPLPGATSAFAVSISSPAKLLSNAWPGYCESKCICNRTAWPERYLCRLSPRSLRGVLSNPDLFFMQGIWSLSQSMSVTNEQDSQ